MHDDYLSIHHINTVTFCPRRYYIQAVLGEAHDNHHMIEGVNLHERKERAGARWVWSDRLQLVGILDQLHYEASTAIITEFKKGRLGDHACDQVQLCAQAMCYEEMTGTELSYGYLYYHSTRRKLRVDFSPLLRDQVEAAVVAMRAISQRENYPAVVDNPKKCSGCSVRETCQPKLASISRKQLERYLEPLYSLKEQ